MKLWVNPIDIETLAGGIARKELPPLTGLMYLYYLSSAQQRVQREPEPGNRFEASLWDSDEVGIFLPEKVFANETHAMVLKVKRILLAAQWLEPVEGDEAPTRKRTPPGRKVATLKTPAPAPTKGPKGRPSSKAATGKTTVEKVSEMKAAGREEVTVRTVRGKTVHRGRDAEPSDHLRQGSELRENKEGFDKKALDKIARGAKRATRALPGPGRRGRSAKDEDVDADVDEPDDDIEIDDDGYEVE